MTHVTCRLTAKNWDHLRNPTLGSRVWATFTVSKLVQTHDIHLMDNIKTWTGLSVEESVRMTEDRDKWIKYVHGVANSRIEDG